MSHHNHSTADVIPEQVFPMIDIPSTSPTRQMSAAIDGRHLALADITVSSNSLSIPSRSLRLIVDEQQQRTVFKRREHGHCKWTIDPSVNIAPASIISISIYKRRKFSDFFRKNQVATTSLVGRTILEAWDDSLGVRQTFATDCDGFRVTFGSSLQIITSRKLSHDDSSNDKLQQLSDIVNLPTSLFYFEHSLDLLRELSHSIEGNLAIRDLISEADKSLEDICKKLPAKNADEDFRSLGDRLYHLLLIVGDPRYQNVVQSDINTLSGIMWVIVEAGKFVDNSTSAAPALEDENSKPRQNTLDDLSGWLTLLRNNFYERRNIKIFEEIEIQGEDSVESDAVSEMSVTAAEDKRLSRWLSPQDDSEVIANIRCLEGTRLTVLKEIHAWIDDDKAPNLLWLTGAPGSGKTAVASSLITGLQTRQRYGGSFFVPNLYSDDPWATIAYHLTQFDPALKASIHTLISRKDLVPLSFENLIHQPLTIHIERLKRGPVVVLDGLDRYPNTLRARLLPAVLKWLELPRECKLVVVSNPDYDIFRAFEGQSIQHMELLTGLMADEDTDGDIRAYIEHRLLEIRIRDEQDTVFSPVQSYGIQGDSNRPDASFRSQSQSNAYPSNRPSQSDFDAALRPRFNPNISPRFSPYHSSNPYQPLAPTQATNSRPIRRSSNLSPYNPYNPILGQTQNLSPPSHLEYPAWSNAFSPPVIPPMSQPPTRSLKTVHFETRSPSPLNPPTPSARPTVSSDYISTLVVNAAGLFAWAKAAMDFVEAGADFEERLRVVNTQSFPHMDELYKTSISRSFGFQPGPVYHATVGAIACAFTSLTLSELSYLLSDRYQTVSPEDVCRRLALVISIGVSDRHLTIRHSSFIHFVSDANRCVAEYQPFFINQTRAHRKLAIACLRLLLDDQHGLRFNICGLTSSHLANKYIPHLAEIAADKIPSHLLYACEYWAVHLTQLPTLSEQGDPEIVSLLKRFLETHLLHWLEVLSVTEKVVDAPQLLLRAVQWLESEREIYAFAVDAHQFVVMFIDAIKISIPHIYLSAVSFAPEASMVTKQYRSMFSHLPDIVDITAIHGPGNSPSWESNVVSIPSTSYHGDSLFTRSPSKDSSASSFDSLISKPLAPRRNSVPLEPFQALHSPAKLIIIQSASIGNSITGLDENLTLWTWNWDERGCVRRPLVAEEPLSFNAIALSSDGRYASTADDDEIWIWDVIARTALFGPLTGHTDWVNDMAFASDGLHLASGSDDNTLRIWDCRTGKPVCDSLEGHDGAVLAVAFASSGGQIVSGSADRSIRLWDAETGAMLNQLHGHTDSVLAVQFSPDDRRIASGSDDGHVIVWDVLTGNSIWLSSTYQGHESFVNSVAWSPDGIHLVSGSSDMTVRVWSVEKGTTVCPPLRGHTGWIVSVAFTSDGERVISSSEDSTTRVWDFQSRNTPSWHCSEHEDWVTAVAFSPSGKYLASGSYDGMILLRDGHSGVVLLEPLWGHIKCVRCLAFSIDSTLLASGSDDGTVRMWSVATGESMQCFNGHSAGVRSIAFAQNQKSVVSGSNDNTVKVWSIGQEPAFLLRTFQGHTDWVYSVAFIGQRIVSGSADGTIRVWDVEQGDIFGPLEAHNGQITCIAASVRRDRIVSGSEDATLCIWDGSTGKPVLPALVGHTGRIISLALSADDRCVFSGSEDSTIRMWDMDTGAALWVPMRWHTQSVLSLTVSQDGTRLASGSADCLMSVWNINTGLDLSWPASFMRQVHNEDVCTIDSQGFLEESRLTNPRDGWILGPHGELLLWIPSYRRKGLITPRTVALLGMSGIVIDMRQFAHGSNWEQCRG